MEGYSMKEAPEGASLTGKPADRPAKDGGALWIYL